MTRRDEDEKVRFRPRSLITGRLTLASPLAIRTGELRKRAPERDGEEAGSTALIELDAGNRPYIPGSSLKGVLRAYACARFPEHADAIARVFGREPEEAAGGRKQATGGAAEFHDAFLAKDDAGAIDERGSTRIDRRTGAAERRSLRYDELVRAGASFTVEITGDGLDDADLSLLLAALDGFGDPHRPIALGAKTGSGKGRADWSLGEVRRMDAADVLAWLAKGEAADWRDGMRALNPLPAKPTAETEPPILELRLELAFDGPFLVSERVPKREGEDLPDLRPTQAGYDSAVLPGESVRGALRAQAERIAATVHGDAGQAMVDRLFGHSSHQGAVMISDFLLAACDEAKPPTCQELVVVDRFTGGAADGAKFTIEHVESPRYQGSIALRLIHAAADCATFFGARTRDRTLWRSVW